MYATFTFMYSYYNSFSSRKDRAPWSALKVHLSPVCNAWQRALHGYSSRLASLDIIPLDYLPSASR